MHLRTPPLLWGVVWDSGRGFGVRGHVLLPTKTSLFWNQFSGGVPFRYISFLHVYLANFVNFLSRLALCATSLSVVSRLLIARYHLLVIPGKSRVLFCMTCSHLSTHIRWAASDSNICRSLRVALSFIVGWMGCWLSSLAIWCLGSDREPVPSMVLRFVLGQSSGACSHALLARFHTSCLGRAVHSVSM